MKKTVKDIELKGKKVFLRCDFNVPLDDNRNITDDRRIQAALPTVQYLMEADGPSGTGSGHTLEFAKSATPDDETAFWDSAAAQKRFAELGVDSFQLWKYGEGDAADDPRAREYCGIYLTFPDESADVMHVDITFR